MVYVGFAWTQCFVGRSYASFAQETSTGVDLGPTPIPQATPGKAVAMLYVFGRQLHEQFFPEGFNEALA